MPQITITLTDTPTGEVSIHSNFVPAIGQPTSPAQAHALDIINRTHKQWGVQRLRPVCDCDLAPTMQEADTGHCMACGWATV